MSNGSVLLLTLSNESLAHSRRSSVSASVSVPASPPAVLSGSPTALRSRGSLPGQRKPAFGGIGGNLGEVQGLVAALAGISGIGDKGIELSVRSVASSTKKLDFDAILCPIESYSLSHTPSAICFVQPTMGSNWSAPSPTTPTTPTTPSPGSPASRRPRPVSSIELSGTTSASAVERVIGHIKRVMIELAGTKAPVIAYTTSETLVPPPIEEAVRATGCVDILCPPFTPDSVRKALTKVPPWSESLSDSQVLEPVSAPKIIVPITIRDPPAKPSLTLASLPSASTSYQTQPTSASSHMSTLPSLAPLIPPPPHLAARASYSCPHVYAPALPLCARRRSVDVGGLALAMSGTAGQGGGWGGWAGAEEELALGVPSRKSKVKADTPAPKRRNNAGDDEVMYAELLSQMYTQTGAAVDGAISDTSPSPPFPYPTGRPHSASDPHIPFAYNASESSTTPAPPTRPQPDTVKSRPSYPDDIDPTRREELIVLLDRWEFEPHKLSEADVLACAGLLFEAALEIEGMEEDVGVHFDQLPPFLRAVRKIYRTQNQYHNFQHALDVFQAVYWFLCRAGLVPAVAILSRMVDRNAMNGTKEEDGPGGRFVNSFGPRTNNNGGKWRRGKVQGRIGVMRNIDVFALLLAAVGHDVGHPGLSNAFMANADTPLSRVFDHKSTLEQLHCALLLRLMHKYGMGHLLSSRPASASNRAGIPVSNGSGLDLGGNLDASSTNGLGLNTGRVGLASYASSPGLASVYQAHQMARQPRGFRWLLVQTVLATDMSVHFKWLEGFKGWDSNGSVKGVNEFKKGTTGLTEDEERLMICQALIKCGDISNPTRPHAVSEHWSKVLLEEWACQATFEQELDLPVTVFNVDVANGAMQQAQGQVNFIDLFTQPLFNVTASVIPELYPITEQCVRNRVLWQERMEMLSASTPTAAPSSTTRPCTISQTQESHYSTIFPLSRPPQLAQSMGQHGVNQTSQTLGIQQVRPSSSGSASTVGAPSLFSPTGSVSSASASGGAGPGPTEPSAMRVAYRASVRKKKSFHRASWPAPVPQPPPLPTMPSPLRER